MERLVLNEWQEACVGIEKPPICCVCSLGILPSLSGPNRVSEDSRFTTMNMLDTCKYVTETCVERNMKVVILTGWLSLTLFLSGHGLAQVCSK